MADIIFVAIVIAFFAAGGGFVVLCDRIVGPADEAGATGRAAPPAVEVAPAKAA